MSRRRGAGGGRGRAGLRLDAGDNGAHRHGLAFLHQHLAQHGRLCGGGRLMPDGGDEMRIKDMEVA